MSIRPASSAIQTASSMATSMAASHSHSHLQRLPLAAFAEQYQVCEEIGSGKFAVVKRCVKNATNVGHKESGNSNCTKQEVAAKFIRKSRSARFGQKTEDIELEIAIVSQLAPHENIIQLVDVFEDVTQVILVFELMKGGELQDYIADYERLTEAEARLFMRQILSALVHLHEKSIVHLDLKPENILLTEEGSRQIKLIDFGISRLLKEKADIKGVYGTPEFIAPEILNYEPIGFGTDLWSVGCIAYTMLYGSSPFLGVDKHDTFANITAAAFDFGDDNDVEHNVKVSTEARDFILACLRKDIRKRMTAAQAMAHPWVVKEEIDKPLIISSSSSKIASYHDEEDEDCDEDITFVQKVVDSGDNYHLHHRHHHQRPSSLGNSSSGTPTNGSTTPTSTTSVGSSEESCDNNVLSKCPEVNGGSSGRGSTGQLDSADDEHEQHFFLVRQRWKRSIHLVILHNRHQRRKSSGQLLLLMKNDKKKRTSPPPLDSLQTESYQHHHHHSHSHPYQHHKLYDKLRSNHRNHKTASDNTFYSLQSSSSSSSTSSSSLSHHHHHSLSSGGDGEASKNESENQRDQQLKKANDENKVGGSFSFSFE